MRVEASQPLIKITTQYRLRPHGPDPVGGASRVTWSGYPSSLGRTRTECTLPPPPPASSQAGPGKEYPTPPSWTGRTLLPPPPDRQTYVKTLHSVVLRMWSIISLHSICKFEFSVALPPPSVFARFRQLQNVPNFIGFQKFQNQNVSRHSTFFMNRTCMFSG